MCQGEFGTPGRVSGACPWLRLDPTPSFPWPDVQPPEGRNRDCLLTVVLRDGSKTTLCAESEDDAV